MKSMKTIILVASVHKGNTKKIAENIASTINADVVDVIASSNVDISEYDNVIIASGVYFGKMHKSMLAILQKLNLKDKNCYLVLTMGSKSDYVKKITSVLKEQNIGIKSSFCCLGYDTYGPFKLVGGLNKNRPNDDDIKSAITWAKENIS